jgi:hypothetical protein
VLEQAVDPFGRIANYYQDLVQKYGHDPRACDYGRPQSQESRAAAFSTLDVALRISIVSCEITLVRCGIPELMCAPPWWKKRAASTRVAR